MTHEVRHGTAKEERGGTHEVRHGTAKEERGGTHEVRHGTAKEERGGTHEVRHREKGSINRLETGNSLTRIMFLAGLCSPFTSIVLRSSQTPSIILLSLPHQSGCY